MGLCGLKNGREDISSTLSVIGTALCPIPSTLKPCDDLSKGAGGGGVCEGACRREGGDGQGEEAGDGGAHPGPQAGDGPAGHALFWTVESWTVALP